jgi:hypothetical protein
MLTGAVAAVALAGRAAEGGGWASYEVYQPLITRHDVLDARAHPHQYNHCATIAWFQDRWFCLWGSHTHPAEHAPGQRIFFSTSRDGRVWTPLELLFSSDTRCGNPVRYPDGKGHQWQPNLAVVDGELWAVWNQGGSARDFEKGGRRTEDLRGVYLSRLVRSDGKWTNRRIDWDGKAFPDVEGRAWQIASTQNPCRLRTGRVLAPVTLYAMDGPAADAPATAEGWWNREKRNSVIYSDDRGATWHLSPGCQTPGFSWIQWEPTVWEEPDGTVRMFARNNTHRGLGHGHPASGQYLLESESRDAGATWSPHRYVPVESVCSRMHVAPLDGRGVWEPAGRNDDFTGRRYAMVHNDAPGAVYDWVGARNNIALFFNRGGGMDFVAGNSVSGDRPDVAYPQMWRHGDTLAVCYTHGNSAPRSIHVSLVSPLPAPDRHYVFPRSNDRRAGPRPSRMGDSFAFNRGQHLATRQAVDPGGEGFSLGAWIRPGGPGTLIDTRPDSPATGFVIQLRGKTANAAAGTRGAVTPLVSLMGPKEEIGVDLPMELNGRWHYLGITVDTRKGEIRFHVNGVHRTVRTEAAKPHQLAGTTAHIGSKRPVASRVTGFMGDVRFLALFAGPGLGPEGHAWLHNRFAGELGAPELPAAADPGAPPILWMDPADTAAFERDFAVPLDGELGGSEVATVDGLQVLRLRDHGSAGIDLDENERTRGDRVTIRFRFRVERGDGQTLCTVGDFNEPARLVARSGRVVLRAGGVDRDCGAIRPEGWTSILLETGGDHTSACVGEGVAVDVQHRPVATWAYLGEGFPEYGAFPGTRLLVDIGSLRTRVERQPRIP